MISVVIPVFNEEESLEVFYASLVKELPKLDKDYEIIFIDDGSTDSSLDILKTLAKKHVFVRVFSFRKNIGKAEALSLGFNKAKGEYIVSLDADLQDLPEEIGKLLTRAKDGVDLVNGWRKNRKDTSQMVIISKIFNLVVSKLFQLNIHDYNCGLKVYRSEVVKKLRLYGGLHRFIPLLVAEQGFIVDEVIVVHEERKFGKSKYGFSKLWKDLPDVFTMLFLVKYGKRPLHFFGTFGGLLFVIGFSVFLYLSILWLCGQSI